MATDPYVGDATMDPYSVWDDETLPGSPILEEGMHDVADNFTSTPCQDVTSTPCPDVSCLPGQQSLSIMKEP